MGRYETLSTDVRSLEHAARAAHVHVNNTFSKFLRISENKFTEQKMSQNDGEAAPVPEQPKAVDDGMTIIQRYQKALAIALDKLNVA